MALFKRKSARKEEIILCMLKNVNGMVPGMPAAFVSKRGMRNGKTALL
jgi:hypothetical protein